MLQSLDHTVGLMSKLIACTGTVATHRHTLCGNRADAPLLFKCANGRQTRHAAAIFSTFFLGVIGEMIQKTLVQ
jgi:hypothetical protein